MVGNGPTGRGEAEAELEAAVGRGRGGRLGAAAVFCDDASPNVLASTSSYEGGGSLGSDGGIKAPDPSPTPST